MNSKVEGARFYRPELDSLRFLAFFLVFVHHAFGHDEAAFARHSVPPLVAKLAGAFLRAGAHGVDLFFVLSAYLITELLLRETELMGRLDFKSFFVRRALRIWPLYFVFLLLGGAVAPMLLSQDSLPLRYAATYGAFVGNWACVLWGYPASTIALLWSVSIEEQFYVAWPILLRSVGPARIAGVAVALAASAVVARIAVVVSGAPHPAMWTNTLCRLDTIAAGIGLAVWLRGRPLLALSRRARVVLVLGALAAWMMGELFAPIEEQGFGAALGTYTLVTLGALAMVLAAHGGASVPPRWMIRKPWVFLGRISYGLYVFHGLAISLVAAFVWTRLPPALRLGHAVVSFSLTVALSTLSWFVLERPALKLKARFTHVPSREL